MEGSTIASARRATEKEVKKQMSQVKEAIMLAVKELGGKYFIWICIPLWIIAVTFCVMNLSGVGFKQQVFPAFSLNNVISLFCSSICNLWFLSYYIKQYCFKRKLKV